MYTTFTFSFTGSNPSLDTAKLSLRDFVEGVKDLDDEDWMAINGFMHAGKQKPIISKMYTSIS